MTKIITTVIITLLVGGVVGFVLDKQTKVISQPVVQQSKDLVNNSAQEEEGGQKNIEGVQLIPITDDEPMAITSDVDTSGWQTYRNEEIGFEIKYPASWIWWKDLLFAQYKFSPSNVLHPDAPYVRVTLKSVKYDLSYEEGVLSSISNPTPNTILRKIIVNGRELLASTYEDGQLTYGSVYYRAERDHFLYVLDIMPAGEIPLEVYKAIILLFQPTGERKAQGEYELPPAGSFD